MAFDRYCEVIAEGLDRRARADRHDSNQRDRPGPWDRHTTGMKPVISFAYVHTHTLEHTESCHHDTMNTVGKPT